MSSQIELDWVHNLVPVHSLSGFSVKNHSTKVNRADLRNQSKTAGISPFYVSTSGVPWSEHNNIHYFSPAVTINFISIMFDMEINKYNFSIQIL